MGPTLTYRFDQFALDAERFELRRGGALVHLEPQVLALLIYLVANAHRMVSKDELVEKIWNGRFISDTAISTRIKQARKALGDDGKRQAFLRTIHGKGVRFVADVAIDCDDSTGANGGSVRDRPIEEPDTTDEDGRPSIAVLPFRLLGAPESLANIADALADEVISDLARLRWLVVISRGSSFRFRKTGVDPREIGRVLKVAYCVSGAVEATPERIVLHLELARTRNGEVIWSDRFTVGLGELHDLRDEIATQIIANLELRIARQEAQLARSRPQPPIDLWSAYHLGIDHMFRFNRVDNAQAAALFAQALHLQPEFSRAHSGLSFTQFQDAFLGYAEDAEDSGAKARRSATRAVQCDPLDPFAYLNLGRSLWLEGEIDDSIDLLQHAIDLSPSHAQAVYSKAWAQMTLCRPESSDDDVSLALRLSPLDPLRYAMLGVRSVNALLRGDTHGAARWGERAARSPGAHKHIAVIAALANHADGQPERARDWIARAKERDPLLSSDAFLRSFKFAPSAGRERIEASLFDLGL